MNPLQSKRCPVCDTAMARRVRKCKECGAPQYSENCCTVCGGFIPTGARQCTACDAYRGILRRHLPFSSKMLAILVSVFTVVGGLFTAGTYVADRHSYTSFRVNGSDSTVIRATVWNSGRKPSSILISHMKFPAELPIEDATLTLVADNDDKTSVVAPGNPMNVSLTVEELPRKIHTSRQYTLAEIKRILLRPRETPLVVEVAIDVEESGHLWNLLPSPYVATRRVQIPASRVEEFILGRISAHDDR